MNYSLGFNFLTNKEFLESKPSIIFSFKTPDFPEALISCIFDYSILPSFSMEV